MLAVPTSTGIAAFTLEIAPAWLRRPLMSTIDTLAIVPSVVYALVGMYFFRLHVWEPVGSFIANGPLGNLTFFGPRCSSRATGPPPTSSPS